MSDRGHVHEKLRGLLAQEKYGILSVSDDVRAYGAIVAFTVSDDLRAITFGTPIATRKYRMLERARPVAFVVDDRSTGIDALMAVSAATLVGNARRLASARERESARSGLLARHPDLQAFLDTADFALFRIEVAHAVHVDRFANVSRWRP